mmetsp:Transcript_28567/g.71701  ORF Transcript_28567/g.71701 Transcript_28567/m.71701 type:complete len:159 (+) Transcript_28567:762-1238(+)
MQLSFPVMDNCLANDIPQLLMWLQEGEAADSRSRTRALEPDIDPTGNPFAATTDNASGPSWIVDATSKARWDNTFYTVCGNDAAAMSGAKARSVMMESGLPVEALSKVWSLADVDKDGALDPEEFALAMFLISMARKEGSGVLPDVLPDSYIPPSKRG